MGMKRAWAMRCILLLMLGAAAIAFGGQWPDDVLQKANSFHDIEKQKQDMPTSVKEFPTISGEDAYKLWQGKKAVFLDVRIKAQYDT